MLDTISTISLKLCFSLANFSAGLKRTLSNWLQSLIGLLHDASVIITPGRTFLRRLIDLIKHSHYRPGNCYIRLNHETCSDILWWHTFIGSWKGLSMMQFWRRQNPDIIIILTFDASSSWGCGAFYDSHWLQYHWTPPTIDYHNIITVKELLPIVICSVGRRVGRKIHLMQLRQ